MHDPEYHSQIKPPRHSPEELLALLQYMADHTRHHAEELHELAHSAPAGAQELIHSACDSLYAGTQKLDEALSILKGA